MTELVIITKDGDNVNIEFQTDDVYVLIVDPEEKYVYNGMACCITGVNDDGTVNVKILYSLDGVHSPKFLNNVPASELSLYYSQEDDFTSDLDDDFDLE